MAYDIIWPIRVSEQLIDGFRSIDYDLVSMQEAMHALACSVKNSKILAQIEGDAS